MGLLFSRPSVYLYGDRKIVSLRFLWKDAPSTKEYRIVGSENLNEKNVMYVAFAFVRDQCARVLL